jgi:L-lysine exporter family protein LysE/ArgO
MEISAFLSGFFINMGLIIGIGAQNAFVLRQAALRQYVFTVVFISIACDMVLISCGVVGLGAAAHHLKNVIAVLRWLAIVLLLWYGIKILSSVFKGTKALEEVSGAISLKKAVLASFAVALLNPHVYFDTVVMLGAASTSFPAKARFSFALGACLVSVAWFVCLGFLASYFGKFLTRPGSWRVLETITGLTLIISATLIYNVVV